MAGNLSPYAQQKIAALRIMAEKAQSVYGQVERFAAVSDPRQAEMMTQPLKRAFGKLKLDLMGAGLDSMSQLAGAMEIAAGRGGNLRTKVRILREGIGSLKFQIEHEQRRVASDDAAAQSAAEAAEHSRRDENAGGGGASGAGQGPDDVT